MAPPRHSKSRKLAIVASSGSPNSVKVTVSPSFSPSGSRSSSNTDTSCVPA